MALSALDWNYLEASRIFAALTRSGEYLERRGVAIASCGLPVEELNWGFLKPPYDDLEGTAASVEAHFGTAGLPFKLVFRGDQRPPLRALEARGYHRGSAPVPGMTRKIAASVPPPPGPLVVEEVCTPEQLLGFREAAFSGFGYPVAAAHLILDQGLLGLPQVRMYVGMVEGVAVATSMLVATGEVAGIYWVATVADQRGRGYGESLTWSAVAGGRERGCHIASLQASKSGRPLYERMGFEHVLDYESLHPPEDRHGGAERRG